MARNPEWGAWRPKAPETSEWLALGAASANATMDAVGQACGLEAGAWRGRHWALRVYGGGSAQVRFEAAALAAVVALTNGCPIQTGETVPVWFDAESDPALRVAYLGTVGSYLVLTPLSD